MKIGHWCIHTIGAQTSVTLAACCLLRCSAIRPRQLTASRRRRREPSPDPENPGVWRREAAYLTFISQSLLMMNNFTHISIEKFHISISLHLCAHDVFGRPPSTRVCPRLCQRHMFVIDGPGPGDVSTWKRKTPSRQTPYKDALARPFFVVPQSTHML